MASKICKIVYFDEDSVTDYVQIVAGGTLEKTTELLNSSDLSEEQKADVSAKGGIGGVFKALLGWEASASGEVSAGLALNRNKMVKNIVKNTILTDFLHIIDENENKSASKTTRGAIKKFEGYVISAEKDSLSYMVMVSPYLSMLRSGSSIPAGDFNIAIDKLENALKNAKGYYEFVGTKGKSKVILRFNINSFKNGYTISDLLKMNLSIYAIKVGRTTIDMLNVSKELEMDVSIIPKDNPSYEESNEVEIYINGHRWTRTKVNAAGYVVIDRRWKSRDEIFITFPKSFRYLRQTNAKGLPVRGALAGQYGPIVYTVKDFPRDHYSSSNLLPSMAPESAEREFPLFMLPTFLRSAPQDAKAPRTDLPALPYAEVQDGNVWWNEIK